MNAIDTRVFGKTLPSIFSLCEPDEVDVAFSDTFDQSVTRPGTEEPFEAWADWFGAIVIPVQLEADIMLGLLTYCPCFKSDTYKDEAVYEVGCFMHGGEESYLDFLALAAKGV